MNELGLLHISCIVCNWFILDLLRNCRYEKCDPNRFSDKEGIAYAGEFMAMPESTIAFDDAPSPPSAPLAGASDATVKEDSFETNNQVSTIRVNAMH